MIFLKSAGNYKIKKRDTKCLPCRGNNRRKETYKESYMHKSAHFFDLIIIYWVSSKCHVLFQMLILQQWTIQRKSRPSWSFHSREETDHNQLCLWWVGNRKGECFGFNISPSSRVLSPLVTRQIIMVKKPLLK